MKKHYFFIIGCLFLLIQARANNLVITSPPSYSSANNTLTFTITWENSWSINAGPTNWDAVWIFVKRQNCSGNNNWVHQLLSTTPADHLVKTVSTSAISTITQVNVVTDGMGVFVRRIGSNVAGNVEAQLVTIKLGSTNPAITTSTSDNFKVFGIEMVNVPQGNFFIGDGRTTNTNNFSNGSSASALQITSTTQSNGIGVAANYVSNVSYGCSASLPAAFPLGYNNFYCMKTEINQGQFTEFLNTLTYTQQTTLMGTYANVQPNILNSYYANVNGNRCSIIVSAAGVYNTKPAVFSSSITYSGANYLTWADLTAFLDWAALRPMTEFEYEKSCRGTLTAVANEYPWGSIDLTAGNISTSANTANEATNTLSTTKGVCIYNTNYVVRGGATALAASDRLNAGATYYGILDMAGNAYEQCIGGAAYDYSGFTNANGDGYLSSTGAANTTGWPVNGGLNSGTILRGGSCWSYASAQTTKDLQTSDRYYYNYSNSFNQTKDYRVGGRGVRSY
jgi:formylglycine-generating enzyme required for sulfatase activity